jgi:hypothetical protein
MTRAPPWCVRRATQAEAQAAALLPAPLYAIYYQAPLAATAAAAAGCVLVLVCCCAVTRAQRAALSSGPRTGGVGGFGAGGGLPHIHAERAGGELSDVYL